MKGLSSALALGGMGSNGGLSGCGTVGVGSCAPCGREESVAGVVGGMLLWATSSWNPPRKARKLFMSAAVVSSK